MLTDRSSNSTPEKICEDFRRFLRERATNHSQFYRRLSATPAIKRLTQRNITYAGDHTHANHTSNTMPYKKISLANKPPLLSPLLIRSQSLSLSASPSPSSTSSSVLLDNILVNHRATTSKSASESDRYVGTNNSSGVINTDDDRKSSLLSMLIDRSNGHAEAVRGQRSDAAKAYTHVAGVDANNDRISNTTKAHITANNTDDTNDENDFDSKQLAINNNNKTFEQDEWNRSNYLTFVRATSLDRATHITGCCHRRSCTDNASDNRNNSNNSSSVLSRSATVERTEKDDQLVDWQSSLSTHDRDSRSNQQYYKFPCVENLVKMYTQLLQEKKSELKAGGGSSAGVGSANDKSKSDLNECDLKAEGLRIAGDNIEMNRNSPLSDEGCPLPYGSPYSSDCEDNENDRGTSEKDKEKVLRSSSSDSALGLDDEAPIDIPPPMNTGRRMTLTVTDIPLRAALLPVAEPITLPDPTVSLDQQQQQQSGGSGSLVTQTAIPSKVILEERIVEIPEDKFTSVSNSRRESAQSCLSDYNSSEYGGVRYVRTPSVVVSDYSDDILCGVTLEEIEYFRAHRMRRRSSADTTATEKDDAASDVSAASSCSNLYYCGSTISALDGADYFVDGVRMPIDRKISDCSTCSTVSGDDDDESYIIQEQEYNEEQQKQQQPIKKHQQKKVRHPKVLN